MSETTMSDAVLARLGALTARLDEQAAEIAGLKGRTAELEAENARLTAELEAENARLTAARATPTAAPSPAPATTSRRGMLRRALGASAAAAVLLIAKEAATAHADARGTIIPGSVSTADYGLAAIWGVSALGGDPSSYLPTDLASKAHGVIGIDSQYKGTIPYYSGVLGAADYLFAAGVQGLNTTGPGVYGGASTGYGVHGHSISSPGVAGQSTNNAGVYAEGPIGLYATGTGVAGVFGGSNGNGFGFWGSSVANAGVYGTSTTGPGVRAESINSFGLHAKSPTWAGVFEGNVFVTGRVVALGGVGASAAAATGTTRTLAEDVGEATLANGKATVALDPAFAEEVKGGRYQVFVTPHDASGRGLAVVARRRDAFDVQELAGSPADTGVTPGRGGSSGFSYRVVAKTAGPAGPRPAPLAPPDLTTIKPAPPLPEPPKAPEPSGASEERRER